MCSNTFLVKTMRLIFSQRMLMLQLYTDTQDVTAEMITPMNHSRAIKPELREGVSSLSGVVLHSGLLLRLLFILFIQSQSTARLKSGGKQKF